MGPWPVNVPDTGQGPMLRHSYVDSMNLTTPTALFWGALAIPIVIFYILKIRMRRIPVSTVMFWEQIFEEKQPRSIWEKLRHLLSLLLQLAFLCLLVTALSDPFFSWEERDKRRIVLVVDNSASMRATDVEPNRLRVAKDAAAEMITSLRVRDEMAIISAGTQPKVICGLTGHQRTLRNALESIPETDGPTRVADAVELADRLLADHPKGNVAVLSDGGFEGADELAQRDNVVWVSIGTAAKNVGITRFQVRRSLLDPIGYQLLVEARNHSDEPVECRLELELDDEIVDVIPLKLEANGTWSQVYDKTSAQGGHLVASLDYEDALSADNSASAILPERRRIPVVLVTEGNLFLEHVFVANSLVDLTVTNELPEKIPGNVVVVYHKKLPDKLPAGNLFVLQPETSTDLWEAGDVIESPIVAKQDKNSDLMAHVRLDNVLMPEARQLTAKSEITALVSSAEDHPLYFSIKRDSGSVLVFSVNLERGDLPLRTAFPIMMSNALAWFEGSGGELREAVSTGAVAEIDLPDNLLSAGGETASELILQAPDGGGQRVPVANGKTTIGPLDWAGVWRLKPALASDGESQPQQPQLEIACNLADPAESDVRVIEDVTPNQTSLTAGIGGRPIWFYLIVIAWIMTAIEWYLYQRRWIS